MLIKKIRDLFKMKDTVAFARELGATVGERCQFLCNPRKALGSEPYLIQIGNHVRITSGVQFITHDGGMWVLREIGLEDIDQFGPIRIGDNVFVGIHSVIMPNVTIGNNVVIGAGAIVTKDIPDNSVAAGVPAKVICSISKYEEKARKCGFYTKSMSATEKKEYLRENKPEWF